MDRALYNKIAVTAQSLTDRFHRYHKEYGGFGGRYMVYERMVFENRPDHYDVISQLSHYNFSSFFYEKYLNDQSFPRQFFDGYATIIEENEIGVHYEVGSVLLHYLAFLLEKEIRSFMEIVKSEDFIKTHKPYLKLDNKSLLKYRYIRHDKIYNYLSKKIEKFKLLHHFLHQTTTIITYDGIYVETNLHRLEKILDNITNIYDFSNIEIK